MHMYLLFLFVAMCLSKVSFLNTFVVDIDDTFYVAYDAQNVRAMTMDANTSDVYFCGDDNTIQHYTKINDVEGCSNETIYDCRSLEKILSKMKKVAPIINGVPDGAKIMASNVSCSGIGKSGNCTFYEYNLQYHQELWSVMDIINGQYFPTIYSKKTEPDVNVKVKIKSQQYVFYNYRLVLNNGPSMKNIDDWISNNC